MSRLIFVFLAIINFSSIYAQSAIGIEKEVSTVDQLAFSDPDSALVLIKKIESKLTEDRMRSKLLLAKGSALSIKHLSSAAIKAGSESYNIALKSKDSLMMIKSLGFLGNQYYILKFNKKAIYFLDQAETLLNRINDESFHQLSANIFFVKALIYKDNLDPAFAISYFNKAIAEYDKNKGSKNTVNINSAKIQIAYSLVDLKEIEKAKSIFLEVIADTKKNKNSEILSYAKVGLAVTYENKKEYNLANEILRSVEQQVKNSANINLLIETYDALTQNYYDQNKITEYDIYSKKLEKLLLQNDKNEKLSFVYLSSKNLDLQKSDYDANENLFYLYLLLIIAGGISFITLILTKIKKLKA